MKRRAFLAGAAGLLTLTAAPITAAQAAPGVQKPLPLLKRTAWIVADHRCTCLNCSPSLAFVGDRSGDNHFARRFFDDSGLAERSDADLLHRYAQVTSNGMAIPGVYEVMVGDPGAVWRFRGVPSDGGSGRHICATCQNDAAERNLLHVTSDGHVNTLYRREWNAERWDFDIVRLTPEPAVCCEQVFLPNVAVSLSVNARLAWEAEIAERETMPEWERG